MEATEHITVIMAVCTTMVMYKGSKGFVNSQGGERPL
ncbi:hypothetical protein SAMN04487884_109131 [Butyrivibrio fibrisolvens]|uniref:Uncharacterized protein n=1 Tax=Butyrivibrio fibrisolvens TaxID=831 RepID=A0A1H9RDP3_BUTFI|nr:hypothetical protein SAMN04487884_109131 [Butyrivibrio fibrisolvens]